MDITIFLAQLWGPIMVAVGLGFFFSQKYYVRIYRDLEKAPFAVLFFGMFAMMVGILQVQVHTVWNTLPEIIVSLLGWTLLVKGVVCTTFIGLADRGGDWALSARIVPLAGAGALILGMYLSWIGYFI